MRKEQPVCDKIAFLYLTYFFKFIRISLIYMVNNRRCNKTFTSNKQMAVIQRLHWSVVKKLKTETIENIWEVDCYVYMYDRSQNNGYTYSIQTCFKGGSKSVLLKHLNIGCLPSATCVFRTLDQKISGCLP